MKRRGFLGWLGASAVAVTLPTTVAEVKPEYVAQDAKVRPMDEVMFVVGRNSIVMARVLKVHEDGRLDLSAKVQHPNPGYETQHINADYLRVRRAKPSDLANWGNMPGTWFLPPGFVAKGA